MPEEPEVVKCPRCGSTMELIVQIEPFGKEPLQGSYDRRRLHRKLGLDRGVNS